MTKKQFLGLSEMERFNWMIEKGWTADESGQVYSWTGKAVGCLNKGQGYVQISVNLEDGRLSIRTHRFVYYFLTSQIPDHIDHINRVKHDNRIENLRSLTHQQNSFNTDAKGHFFNKRDKRYQAQIQVNGNKIHLGCYETKEQARAAHLEGKEKYHKI